MRLPRFDQFEPVLIEWADAVSVDSGWTELSADHTCVHGMVTVGQVFCQERESVTLVLSWDDIYQTSNAAITIPTVAVTAFRRLK